MLFHECGNAAQSRSLSQQSQEEHLLWFTETVRLLAVIDEVNRSSLCRLKLLFMLMLMHVVAIG